MDKMTEQELYLFDLHGYLVVPNALTSEQVYALNQILDEHIAEKMKPDAKTHRFWDMLDWGKAYVDLIDNPRLLPHLRGLIGYEFRLDHLYLDVIRSGKGPVGTRLHGGRTPFRAEMDFRFENGRMYNGLTVVAYNLKSVGPGDGGFGCIPGSHKSNYPFPAEWKEMEEPHPLVERVTGPAGTAVIFTEALTHGTLPWTGEDERRTVFFKYNPASMAWSPNYFDPDAYEDLSQRQIEILQAPNNERR